MAVSKGTVALLHPPPHFCTRWPASHLEVSVSLWMKCQIKCDVKCFYYNPKSQYCTMLHVLIIDSLHIINNNTKMIQRSVSEDPVKMNESFLFSLATSAEPMQFTWKMNERWTKDLPEDSVGRWTKHWPEDTVGRWTIRSSAGYRSLDHFSRDLHWFSRGNSYLILFRVTAVFSIETWIIFVHKS